MAAGSSASSSLPKARLLRRQQFDLPRLTLHLAPDPNNRLPAFGHGGSDGTMAVAMPELDATALIFTQSRGNGVIRFFVPLARRALTPEGLPE